MVPERNQDGTFLNDRDICGKGNVWSIAER